MQGTLPTPLLLGRHRQASQWTQAGEQPEVSPHLQSRLLWAVGFRAPCPPGLRSAVPSRAAPPAGAGCLPNFPQSPTAYKLGEQQPGDPNPTAPSLPPHRPPPAPLRARSSAHPRPPPPPALPCGGAEEEEEEGGEREGAAPRRSPAALRSPGGGVLPFGSAPPAPRGRGVPSGSPGRVWGGIWQSRLAARLGSAGEGAWSPSRGSGGEGCGGPAGYHPRGSPVPAAPAAGWGCFGMEMGLS